MFDRQQLSVIEGDLEPGSSMRKKQMQLVKTDALAEIDRHRIVVVEEDQPLAAVLLRIEQPECLSRKVERALRELLARTRRPRNSPKKALSLPQ